MMEVNGNAGRLMDDLAGLVGELQREVEEMSHHFEVVEKEVEAHDEAREAMRIERDDALLRADRTEMGVPLTLDRTEATRLLTIMDAHHTLRTTGGGVGQIVSRSYNFDNGLQVRIVLTEGQPVRAELTR